MRKSLGFTLIELVVVIVILGILAAFAAPKFISLEGDARTSSINGLAGAIKSSTSLVHSLAVAKNQTGGSGKVAVEGVSVELANGYPAATADGLIKALDINANDYSVTHGRGTSTFTITGYTPSSGSCNIVYTSARSSQTPPTIALTTTGC